MYMDRQYKIQMLESKVEQLENNQSMLFDIESRITIVERSTFNGSFFLKIREISKRREDARTGKCTSMDSPPFYSKPNGRLIPNYIVVVIPNKPNSYYTVHVLYMYNKCDAAVTGYAQPLMINILLTATIYVVY